jgi:hypothetical protein
MAGTVFVSGRLEWSSARPLRPQSYTSPVAKPVQTAPSEDAPPLDPEAVERAYLFHRARREARNRRRREKRWAGFRFWLVLVLVVAAAVLVATRTLGEIERVFGL